VPVRSALVVRGSEGVCYTPVNVTRLEVENGGKYWSPHVAVDKADDYARKRPPGLGVMLGNALLPTVAMIVRATSRF